MLTLLNKSICGSFICLLLCKSSSLIRKLLNKSICGSLIHRLFQCKSSSFILNLLDKLFCFGILLSFIRKSFDARLFSFLGKSG